MKKDIKKVIVYVRVSSREQVDEGNSLVTQERLCREFCEKNNYIVDRVFIEKGESAKNINRTELRKMLEHCSLKRNGTDALIIYKIDRLSRNTDDYSQIRIMMKKYNVEIISISERFENNPVGRFVENMLANTAQFDNDVRTERCTNGMKEAVLEGRYVWGAGIGYINTKVSGKANIAPDAMAPLVKEMFSLIATGLYPLTDVRKMMAEKGLRLKNGNEVSKQHYYELIRNPIYMGLIYKFGEVVQGTFESIISEELFYNVQKVIKNNGRKTRVYQIENDDFPLKRFIFNEEGDKKMTGSWSKGRNGSKYAYYNFPGKGKSIKKEIVENTFIDYMNNYYIENDVMDQLESKIKDKFLKATELSRVDASKNKSKLSDLERMQNSLVDKNLTGVINDSLFSKRMESLEIEINELKNDIALHADSDYSFEELLGMCREYFTNPGTVWNKANVEEKIKLQWFEFPSGITFDGENFRTREISLFHKAKSPLMRGESVLVDPTGFEPVTSSLQMKRSTN